MSRQGLHTYSDVGHVPHFACETAAATADGGVHARAIDGSGTSYGTYQFGVAPFDEGASRGLIEDRTG